MNRPPEVIDIPASKPRPDDLWSYTIPRDRLKNYFKKGWLPDPAYICNVCKTPSLVEIEGDKKHACETCGYSTRYVEKFFTKKTEETT